MTGALTIGWAWVRPSSREVIGELIRIRSGHHDSQVNFMSQYRGHDIVRDRHLHNNGCYGSATLCHVSVSASYRSYVFYRWLDLIRSDPEQTIVICSIEVWYVKYLLLSVLTKLVQLMSYVTLNHRVGIIRWVSYNTSWSKWLSSSLLSSWLWLWFEPMPAEMLPLFASIESRPFYLIFLVSMHAWTHDHITFLILSNPIRPHQAQ